MSRKLEAVHGKFVVLLGGVDYLSRKDYVLLTTGFEEHAEQYDTVAAAQGGALLAACRFPAWIGRLSIGRLVLTSSGAPGALPLYDVEIVCTL